MIALLHLVWAPLGRGPLRDFLASYRAHDAGSPHELVIVLNGLGAAGAPAGFRDELDAELDGLPHRVLELDQPALDLTAYGRAAKALDHELICALNSYSVIGAERWLAKLAAALERPEAGLAGATASWESQSEWRRGRMRFWPYQLARLPIDRPLYPRFPNPHIRTTGFIAARELLIDAGFADADTKPATYRVESGRGSVTRVLDRLGLQPLVVGRDGRVFTPEEWPDSATYRSLAQSNLLISDNRTREWDRAGQALKTRLARDAWGARARV